MSDAFRENFAPLGRAPSVSELSRFYGITRQGLHQACKRLGVTPDFFKSPSRVFALLEHGVRSPLRQRLADPAEQALIQTRILESSAKFNTERLSNERQATTVLS